MSIDLGTIQQCEIKVLATLPIGEDVVVERRRFLRLLPSHRMPARQANDDVVRVSRRIKIIVELIEQCLDGFLMVTLGFFEQLDFPDHGPGFQRDAGLPG